MSYSVSRFGGIFVAAAGAVAWLVNLVWWEPMAEPAKPWGDYAAENNTYWARDLRWCAIAAALVGLIWAVRGARRSSTVIAVLGLLWVIADALLDRLSVGPAFGRAAIAAVVVAAVVVGWTTRRAPAPLPEAGRGPLVIAAFVGAATAPIAAGMASIHDNEVQLAVGGYVAGGLLVIGAFGAATAAGPRPTRARVGVLAILSVIAGLLMVVARVNEPAADWSYTLAVFALAVVTMTGVYGLRTGWPVEHGIVGLAVAAVGMAVGYTVLGFVAIFLSIPVGEVSTSLAGNPAVNSSDTDGVMAFIGYAVGFLVGAVVATRDGFAWWPSAAGRLDSSRPDPRIPAV